MKFLAILVLALGVAAAVPTRAVTQEWTLPEITAALEDPATSPVLVPYLIDALNAMMASLHTGGSISTITIALPVDVVAAITPVAAPEVAPVTLPAAVAPEVTPEVAPVTLPEAVAPEVAPAHPIVTPVSAVDYVPLVEQEWTLAEIDAALTSPDTNPAMIPYLTEALDSIMHSLFAGEQVTSVVVAVPVTVVDAPVDTAVVATPVAAPVATPAAPVAAETPSGPLVQIILNINSQQVGEQIVAPEATPVHGVSVGPAFVEAVPSEADISPALVDFNPIDAVAVSAPESVQVAVPAVAGPMI